MQKPQSNVDGDDVEVRMNVKGCPKIAFSLEIVRFRGALYSLSRKSAESSLTRLKRNCCALIRRLYLLLLPRIKTQILPLRWLKTIPPTFANDYKHIDDSFSLWPGFQESL